MSSNPPKAKVEVKVPSPQTQADVDLVINYIHEVMSDPESSKNLGDGAMIPSNFVRFINDWQAGMYTIMIPTIRDECIGLYHIKRMNWHIYEGFQCIKKEYRKHSMQALIAATEKVFEITDASAIMGFIDKINKPALLASKYAGFKKTGEIKNYILRDGDKQDVYIVVKERE